MSDYLKSIPLSTPVSDIRVTATKTNLKFVTTRPALKLIRGEPKEVVGELRHRFRVHLMRLEKRGYVEIEPLDKTQPSAEIPQSSRSQIGAAMPLSGENQPPFRRESKPKKKAKPASDKVTLEVKAGVPVIDAPTLGTPKPPFDPSAEEDNSPEAIDELLGDL